MFSHLAEACRDEKGRFLKGYKHRPDSIEKIRRSSLGRKRPQAAIAKTIAALEANIDRQLLTRYYYHDRKTLLEIGRIFHVHPQTILKRMAKWNMEPRPRLNAPDGSDLPVFHSEEAKCAWLAAWLDAEGSIMLCRGWWGREKYSLGYTYMPRITIGSTTLSAIQAIYEVLYQICGGGRLHRHDGPNSTKPYYEIILYPNGIRKFLPKVKNFLLIKSRQADLILEALDLLEQNRRNSGIHRSKPGGEKLQNLYLSNMERLTQIHQEIKQLNGVKPSGTPEN